MTKREAAKFWRDVERSAERILRQPEWMRAGITLNAANYETYAVDQVATTHRLRFIGGSSRSF